MVQAFRLIGLLEGLSFVILLGVAMPLKYLAGMPEAVRVVGMAHGILFLIYVIAAALVPLKGGPAWRLGALAAAVLPLGPFVFDRMVDKREGWGT